ncbi:flagellar hook-length control protein FliK [Sphingomonas sp. M6A6_1c]
MNVADAIVSTPGASAAPATPADAGAGAFGALIDIAANDAGADVAAMARPGDRPADAAAALVRLPMATVRWPALTAQSALAGASPAAPDGAVPDAPLGAAPADRAGASAPIAVVADASSDPTPADRADASTAIAAVPTLHVVGGTLSPQTPVTTAPVVTGNTPPDTTPAAAVPHATPTPSASTQAAEPKAAPFASSAAAQSFVPRDLSAAPAKTAVEDVRSDAPPATLTDTEGAAEVSPQAQPDTADALATRGTAPTKPLADTRTAHAAAATSLPTRAAPRLTTLVADAGNTPTVSTTTEEASPAVPGKIKAPDDDDTGEPQTVPPMATAMPVDPSVAAMVAAAPTPSASLAPIKRDGANAADGDRLASAAVSPTRGATEPAPRGVARPDDPAPAPTAPPQDGAAGAAILPSRDTAAATNAQPQSSVSAAVVAAQPGRIGREVGVQIARHVADGKSEVTIRLDPANMGRIDVRLSFDDAGRLTAAVHADSPASLAMLRSEAGDLGRSLTDAGIRADVSAFSFDSRGNGGSAGGFGQPGQHQSRSPQADARYAAGQAADGDRLSFRSLRTSDRVDLIA